MPADLKTQTWGSTAAAWNLDARALKAADRWERGLPADFLPHLQYGYRRDADDALVLVPLGLRTRRAVDWTHLSAAAA